MGVADDRWQDYAEAPWLYSLIWGQHTCSPSPSTDRPSENALMAGVLNAMGRGCRNDGADMQPPPPLVLASAGGMLGPPGMRGAAGSAPRPARGAAGAPSSGGRPNALRSASRCSCAAQEGGGVGRRWGERTDELA